MELRVALVTAALTAICACGDSSATPDVGVVDDDAGVPPDFASWAVPMNYGFEGSPTLCDIEGDGDLELIVPLTSFFGDLAPDSYIAIVQAATGTLRAATPEGVGGFAYPYCADLDGDGMRDIITAGRYGDVEALSGNGGVRLWSLADSNPGVLDGDTYTTVSEPGGSVLFVTTGGGGNPEVSMPDVPGKLVAYDATGSVLAVWPEPDEAEVYSSPAVARWPADTGDLFVTFGSGGERLGGTLHLLRYDEATDSFDPQWGVPSACATGGFISSPMFGDVTGDGAPDVIGVDFCGVAHVVELDGTEAWTYTADVPYATANPLLADLNGDGVYDVVAAFESLNLSFPGMTDDNPRTQVLALDGPTGGVIWDETVPNYVFAGPVSADRDGDGTEDVWLLRIGLLGGGDPAFEIRSGVSGAVVDSLPTGNMAGTPVLADFDGDGDLDVVLTHLRGTREPGQILGIEFADVPYSPADSYSGFRGVSDHDGYRK